MPEPSAWLVSFYGNGMQSPPTSQAIETTNPIWRRQNGNDMNYTAEPLYRATVSPQLAKEPR